MWSEFRFRNQNNWRKRKLKNKKKTVLVVLGGISKEREVSLNSGRACIKALKKLGYKVNRIDPKFKALNQIDKLKNDYIFNALHGKYGEDGNAQSMFEYLQIPYTHSGVISSINSMDKVISKEIFIENKILTPKYFDINTKNISFANLKKNLKIKRISFPIVLKPVNEGSSIGVNICKDIKELKISLNRLKKNYLNIICEEYIGGKEIQVAVLNNKALGAIELKPKRKFYDYKAKYLKSAKTSHIMPANLNSINYTRVLKIAEKTHKIMNCSGVTRSDFKFFKNKFYLLEINTQPGMTSLSLVPEIAQYRGISFENLVKKILLDASINK